MELHEQFNRHLQQRQTIAAIDESLDDFSLQIECLPPEEVKMWALTLMETVLIRGEQLRTLSESKGGTVEMLSELQEFAEENRRLKLQNALMVVLTVVLMVILLLVL